MRHSLQSPAVGPFLQSSVFHASGRLSGIRNDRGPEGLVEEIYEVDSGTGAA